VPHTHVSPTPQRWNQQHVCPRPPQTQLPPTQAPLVAHVRPHAPQFASSSRVLTQRPAQAVCPAGQPQRPPAHEAPAEQTAPHAPQLRMSVIRLVQLVPHTDCPAGHWHEPMTQV